MDWQKLFDTINITELFKGVKGDGKRLKWSLKRSIGGGLISYAVVDMQTNGITNQNLILVGLALLPLCLSFFEKK